MEGWSDKRVRDSIDSRVETIVIRVHGRVQNGRPRPGSCSIM